MTGLFEQIAVDSRDLARNHRPYLVTIAIGNVVDPVRVLASNPADAICRALGGRELNGDELRISARLVGQ